MPAVSTAYYRAFSSGFALVLCAACATYVDEPPLHGSLGLGDAGSAGSGATAGDQSLPGGGDGGGPAAGGAAGTSSAGSSSGGSAGSGGGGGSGGALGGAGAGGASGKAGAGSGGSAGAGGKASGGSGGGGGGSGGSGQVQTCAARPIPAKSSWKLSASHSQPNNAQPVGNAHDDVLNNRWSTGKDQSGDEWLQIDFGVEVALTKLTLLLGSSINDYPRMYQARVSNGAMNTAAPVLASGSGQASMDTVMTFPKGTRGRYALISQLGSAAALWWSVAEIQTECAD